MPAKKAKKTPETMKTYPNTREDMERNFHIKLTDQQIFELCQDGDLLQSELAEDACDTMFREHLIDAICRKVLGENWHWPINMDSDEYKDKFYTAFLRGCLEHGIALGEKWNPLLKELKDHADTLKDTIRGQQTAKRAIEVAVVKDLTVFLIGPRGGGKQFLEKAFPEAKIRWMHSCPCGHHGDIMMNCICTPERRNRWLAIMRTRAHNSDIVIEVDAVPYKMMTSKPEPMAEHFHERIRRAKIYAATLMGEREQEEAAKRTEEMAVRRLGLPLSVLERIRKVANAIADLDGSPIVKAKHLAEAAQYRGPSWMLG